MTWMESTSWPSLKRMTQVGDPFSLSWLCPQKEGSVLGSALTFIVLDWWESHTWSPFWEPKTLIVLPPFADHCVSVKEYMEVTHLKTFCSLPYSYLGSALPETQQGKGKSLPVRKAAMRKFCSEGGLSSAFQFNFNNLPGMIKFPRANATWHQASLLDQLSSLASPEPWESHTQPRKQETCLAVIRNQDIPELLTGE